MANLVFFIFYSYMAIILIKDTMKIKMKKSERK